MVYFTICLNFETCEAVWRQTCKEYNLLFYRIKEKTKYDFWNKKLQSIWTLLINCKPYEYC